MQVVLDSLKVETLEGRLDLEGVTSGDAGPPAGQGDVLQLFSQGEHSRSRLEKLLSSAQRLLRAYPQVYIDIGGNTWPYPREFFYAQLKKFIGAGFGKRILFGSDQMVWPELTEKSIAIVEEAPFPSVEQKRDILYNNAARFLRLGQEEIDRHHGR